MSRTSEQADAISAFECLVQAFAVPSKTSATTSLNFYWNLETVVQFFCFLSKFY